MKVSFTKTLKLSFDGKTLISEVTKDIKMDVPHVIENQQAAMALTDGKKFISLVLLTPDMSITFEAQKEALTKEKYKNTIAQAIVIHSLAQRILGNFMIKFIKFPCPCVLFSARDKALAWLEDQWKKNGMKEPLEV